MKIPIQSKPVKRELFTAQTLNSKSVNPSSKCGCPNECLGACADGVCLGPCV